MVTEEGRNIAELCRGSEKQRIIQLCDEIDRLANQLVDLQRRGLVKFSLIVLILIKYILLELLVTHIIRVSNQSESVCFGCRCLIFH